MSSEFERLLREARGSLPEPEADVTDAARRRAVSALKRRRPRARIAGLVVSALVIAALGVGAGTLIAPSGTASQGPAGLGFLPEEGWYVIQAGTDATPERPGIAIASNIPLSPEDGASIVPYSTLLRLPADGIVIVANFTGRVGELNWFGGNLRNVTYFGHKLPLRIEDASPYIQYGGQIRPEEPLGQYQLTAEVNGYVVDLHFYFGTPEPSSELRAEAQRQLSRLVVRAGSPNGAGGVPSATTPRTPTASEAGGVLDRTFVCSTDSHGGVYEIETRAHAGFRSGSSWAKLPYAVVSTGGAGGSLSGNQAASQNFLVWITAGNPVAETTVDNDFWTFPVRVSGTIGVLRAQCRASKARVPLSRAGLVGGPQTPLGDEYDCVTPRKVLIRVRARLRSQGDLKQRPVFLATSIPTLDAKLSVRTLSGKPLVYAEVFQSGRTPFYTARGCVRD
jgi:hypothetical protein